MKATKKLFALVLALVMAMALSVSASAATIEITGNEGETYTAYKVLDVTTTANGDGYSYTTSSQQVAGILQQYGYTVTQSSAGNLWYVSLGTSTDADGLTKYLASLSATELVELLGEAVDDVTLDSKTGTIDELGAGYYFVTSTLGSLCMLNTAADTAEVNDKNKEPDVDKTVSDADAQIGDTVTYTVTIDVPANTESLTLTDTLSKGLTLDEESFGIKVDDNGNTVLTVKEEDIEYNEDGSTTFTVDLTDYLTGEDCSIVVTYTATINENAIENPATNEAVISYGNSSSVSSTTTTKTHTLTIKKTDSQGNSLSGAEFTLKDAENNLVYVVSYQNGYRVATADEVTNANTSGATTTIVVNGSVTIYGLDAETYTLTETKAPDGYNLLTESKTVTVTADDKAEITIENESGSLLPSTGGMGTTVIYIVGALLVVGAGVVLVVRRRMSAE